MVTNPDIDVITFTGGVRVGKIIAGKTATSAPHSSSAAMIR